MNVGTLSFFVHGECRFNLMPLSVQTNHNMAQFEYLWKCNKNFVKPPFP